MSSGVTQQASGSSATSNTLEIDFLVPGPDSARALHELSLVDYIQSLFKVQVSVPGTRTSQGEWITLNGRQENVAKAKNYILALCTPAVRVEACRQSAFANFLFSQSSTMRYELERDYQAVLTRESGGVVVVQGSEASVYSTLSKLNSMMETMQNGTAHAQPTLQFPTATVAMPTPVQSTTPEPNVDELIRQLPDDFRKALYDGLASRPVRRGPVLSRGADEHRREQRIKYFIGLGYSRAKVEAVLGNLPDADDHVILDRLVRCPPSNERDHSRSRLREPLSSVTPVYVPARPVNPEQLRHIVIDGSNVAMRHGNGQVFSCKGIQLAVDYFKMRGHTKITVFVPEWRKEASTPDSPITDQHILHSLQQEGYLKYTPSRRLPEGRRIVCYDDRYIVKLATDEKGVIVSNDQYRDLVKEKAEWKEVIETRLLQFTFANDYFMPPDDPLGRNGPSLDQLLSKDPLASREPGKASRKVPTDRAGSQEICPHLERCTFGRKCKYYHPERDQPESTGSTGNHTPSSSRSPTPSPSPDKRYALASSRSSREDLKSGYHGDDHSPGDINLRDLNEQLAGMTLQSETRKPPQYINLQSSLDQYPQKIIRSTPSLPTPQDPSLMPPPDSMRQERRHMRTFPLMNLSQGPPSYVGRPKGVTEDFSHQLAHQGSHPVTPSLPLRPHPHEHEIYPYDSQQHMQPRHFTGFPGPGGMPHPSRMRDTPPPMSYQSGVLPRGDPQYSDQDMYGNQQGGDPARYDHMGRYSDPSNQYVQPSQRNYSHHQLVPSSHSYPQLQTPSHHHRLRTHSEGPRGNPCYDVNLYIQAVAVLPQCEDRIKRVFKCYPHVSSLDEVVELVRSMD